MRKFLLLTLATLSVAQAQLMNPPVTISKSAFFNTYKETSPGTFQYGLNTLKLTSKAGVVLKAELTSNLSLQEASKVIAFLTDYGEDFAEPVHDFFKQNEKNLPTGVTVEDQESQYSISVQKQQSILKLSVERFQFPEGTFPKNVPTYGNKNAKAALRILSDYQCPYCQKLALEALPMWKEQSSKLGFKIEHHPFPLEYHKNAFAAAEASECAEAQGKFWEFTDQIFQKWDWAGKAQGDAVKQFSEVAKTLKLDIAKFNTCQSTHQFKDKVNEGLETGRKARLGGTPSVYVGNFKVGNWSDWNEVALLIKISQ